MISSSSSIVRTVGPHVMLSGKDKVAEMTELMYWESYQDSGNFGMQINWDIHLEHRLTVCGRQVGVTNKQYIIERKG